MSTATLSIEKKKALVPQLRFLGYEGEWKNMKLGQVCDKIQDGNYGGEYPKADEFVETGIPFLTSKALGGDGFLKEDKIDFIPIEKHIKLKKAQLKLNDVLFTNRGSNVGSIGFTDSRIAHGNIGPQLTLLRSDLKTITPFFLYQIMKSEITVKQIRSQDSGSAMNFFGINTTSKFKLSIPTLPEQKKIASFLSAVDEKIQQLFRKKELLEQYKKGVMQQLFSGKLRFKDENGNDYADWEDKKLGEVTENIKSGKSNSSEDGKFPLYGSTGIIGKCVEPSHEGVYILIARVGANAGTINFINDRFGVSDNTLVLTCNQNSLLRYLFHYLGFYNLNRLVFGSGQPLITGGQLKALKLNLPSLLEQQKIADFLSNIDTKIETTNRQINQTQSFKKGLLQQMFV